MTNTEKIVAFARNQVGKPYRLGGYGDTIWREVVE